jgi:hypothetical protein
MRRTYAFWERKNMSQDESKVEPAKRLFCGKRDRIAILKWINSSSEG